MAGPTQVVGYNIPLITGLSTKPYTLVDAGWNMLSSLAKESYYNATSFVNGLSEFNVAPVNFAVSFTPPEIGDLPRMPEAPDDPLIENPVFYDPGTIALKSVDSVSPGEAPEFTGTLPSISYENKPDKLSAEVPGEAPTVGTVALPGVPDIEYPDVPTLLELSIPDIPEYEVPLFTGEKPTDNLEQPDVGLVWSEASYNPELSGLSTKLANMLAFDYDAAETAIWERGQERVRRTTDEAVRAMYDDFASRGFTLPSGVAIAADMELRSKQADTLADNAREAMIKAAEVNRDKLALAIQQGIVYESQLMTYSGQRAQRALDAAKATADIAISLFNARITIFNARLQAYQTDAQVYRDLIQAELAKLERYKIILDGQKLIGDINLQNIEIYKAKHSALMAVVEVYKAQIDGAKAQIDVDRARIDAFKATVDAYKSQVDAKSAEYGAWAETIKAEAAKMGVYETEAKAFASMVDAYRAKESVKVDAVKAQIEENSQAVESFKARVGYMAEQIRAEVSRITAAVQIYEGQSRVYASKVQAVDTEGRLNIAKSDIALRAAQTEAELYLKKADMDINQVQRSASIESAAMEAAGKTAAQLSASAMSAFNLGASISSASNSSWSQQLSENWSGEIPTPA